MSLGSRFRNTSRQVFNDLGFGTVLTDNSERFVQSDGTFNIHKKGARVQNAYKAMVTMSWTRFFIFVTVTYFGINAFFACLYMLNGVGGINGLDKSHILDDFLNSFFLSVQTFTSVGYGALNPNGHIANIISTFNAFTGLLSFALATGLVFARFSRPVSAIEFSENALITPYMKQEGMSCFQFRMVNPLENQLLDVRVQVFLSWVDGALDNRQRHFRPLKLERDQLQLLPLNWTVVHPIDEESPLFAKDEAEIRTMAPEFLIMVRAYDEVFAQKVHKNTSYITKEIRWNEKFVRMYYNDKDKGTILDLDKLSETESIDTDVQR